MPEQNPLNQNPNPSGGQPGFVQKPVSGPSLGFPAQPNSAAGSQKLPQKSAVPMFGPKAAKKTFYQANKIYIWAIIIGAVIISTLSYFVFKPSGPVAPQAAKVVISADAPSQIPSDSDAIYKFKIDNQDSQKLVNMQLELTYPDGFSYESSNPNAQNLSGTLFAVPDLISGQNAVIIVKLRASGNVNDAKTVSAKLHYHFSNFSSEYVASQDFASTIGASNLALTLTGPQTTSSNQLVVYTVSYQNNSAQDISNARLHITYPDGFSFGSASPQPDLGSDTWSIDKLFKNASSTISIQGSFKSVSPGQSKIAQVDFLVLSPSGSYGTQASANFTTAINSTPLLVTQELEQSQTSNIANPGDQITIKVQYQNNTAVPATGVNIQATLDSKALDLGSIQAEGGQINNNTITWNQSSVSQLGSLTPSQSGQFNFSVRVKDPATKDSSTNLSAISHIQISANEYQTPFPGEDLTVKISSPSSLSTALAFLSGQLPPKVGQDTVYQVSLTLKNSTNDFSNTAVTAFVPLGAGGFVADSFNLQESGRASYDASTGKLTWNVGNLAAHTGQFTAARTLTFKVKLNPSASQVNQSPVLVKTITYTATDNYTGQSVAGGADDITTSSVSGQNGFNNGQVSP